VALIKRYVLLVLFLDFCSTAMASVRLPMAQMPYTAVREIVTETTTLSDVRVLYTPGKERMELALGGVPGVSITRYDRNVAWVLMPQLQVYSEYRLDESGSIASLARYIDLQEMTLVDRQSVNGYETNRYRIRYADRQGVQASGHVWLTQHDIPVALSLTGSHPRHGNFAFRMTQRDIRVSSPPEDALFELPPGYQPAPPFIGDLLDAFPGLGGR
jgi:hypothetical protein